MRLRSLPAYSETLYNTEVDQEETLVDQSLLVFQQFHTPAV